MRQFHTLFKTILEEGERKPNRTGVDTLSIFGYQMRFNLLNGFPIVTGKHVSFHNVLTELLWFLLAEENTNFLHEHNVKIWDAWSDGLGNVGPIYGCQWRAWNRFSEAEEPIDQLQMAIDRLRINPLDRRLIVSAWNPEEIPHMALPPCHTLFQFNAVPRADDESGECYWLDCQLYQRSADTFIGVPYNVASYALLLTMVAQVASYGAEHRRYFKPRYFVWTGGDVHLYENHIQQVKEYMNRPMHPLPLLQMNPEIRDIDDFKHSDFALVDYLNSGVLTAPVAV